MPPEVRAPRTASGESIELLRVCPHARCSTRSTFIRSNDSLGRPLLYSPSPGRRCPSNHPILPNLAPSIRQAFGVPPMSAASLLEGLDASTLATLERNDIRTVEDLQALSEGDVQELGLSIGHRNQLQKRIAAARKPEPTERTPLAGASIIADGSKKEPTERTPLAGASIIGDREYVGDGSKKAGGGVCNGVCICVSICIVVGLGVGAAFMFSVPNERDTSFDCTTSPCCWDRSVVIKRVTQHSSYFLSAQPTAAPSAGSKALGNRNL